MLFNKLARVPVTAVWVCLCLTITACTSQPSGHVLSGTIEAEEATVAAEQGGTVVSISVDEGTVVKKGQVLAQLDDRSQRAALKEAEAVLAQAEARLEEGRAGSRSQTLIRGAAAVQQAEAGVAAAQARQAEAKSQLVRAREQLNQLLAQWEGAKRTLAYQQDRLKELTRLYQDGGATKRDVEAQQEAVNQASTAVEQLRAQVEAGRAQVAGAQSEAAAANAQTQSAASQLRGAQADLDLLKAGNTDYTLKALLAAEQQARARVEMARLQLEKTRIVAPVDGVVMRRDITEGDVVKPGATLFTVMKQNRLSLTVYVPEADLGHVKVGDRVQVSVDAYPGEAFPGVVTAVASKAEFTPNNVQTPDERTKLVFAVTIRLESGFDKLKPGMPADVVFAGGRDK